MPQQKKAEEQKEKSKQKQPPQKRARELNRDQLEELRRKLQKKYR